MSKQIIHIYGASGSGTTTLGKAIANEYGYYQMDTDDYYWLPTDPMFIKKRDKSERIALMIQDIKKYGKVVITGSLVDWGDAFIPYFDLTIRVVTDKEIRIERIKKREYDRFGNRIEVGGDMYVGYKEFLDWAAAYDTGDVHMRSKAKHDKWQKLLTCEQIVVDGSEPITHIMNNIELFISPGI